MGKIVTALASSHAFTLVEPDRWDEFREKNREYYAQLYGEKPPVHPKLDNEDTVTNEVRYSRIRDGLREMRRALEASHPDVLLVIGDDQNENYSIENIPQFGVYTGKEVTVLDRGTKEEKLYQCDQPTAQILLEGLLEKNFDVSFSERFANNQLRSHAHAEPLNRVLVPNADIPIIPIFVNGIHWPAPNPARCYAFGEALSSIIRNRLDGKRVAIYASGGLSHFSAGFPYAHYDGPLGYGHISEEFDRKIIAHLLAGDGKKLSELSNSDLLENGELELRTWIILLGAVHGAKADVLAYEPFYRAIMAMSVAKWNEEDIAV
ncbi:DODA-type extradiol aromatic ring-opening family dioxygenase [Paraburkholderia caledonica]